MENGNKERPHLPSAREMLCDHLCNAGLLSHHEDLSKLLVFSVSPIPIGLLPTQLAVHHLLNFWGHVLVGLFHQLDDPDGLVHVLARVGDERERLALLAGTTRSETKKILISISNYFV